MKYDRVFTPGAPVASRQFLFGRKQELADLRTACKRPGIHPIVIGHRGVGKTSLVHLAFADAPIQRVQVSCSPHMTFARLATEILRQIGYDVDRIDVSQETERSISGKAGAPGFGGEAGSIEREGSRQKQVAEYEVDPWTMYQALRHSTSGGVIVIDEYEAIGPQDQSTHAAIAYLIKHLADHAFECGWHVVLVGVAQSARDLLGRHESIERSGREIYLRPLRREDVHDFLSNAEVRLRITFEPAVKKAIVENSMGYPYYVHLVGLECLDAMIARDRRARRVTPDDLEQAVLRAVQHAFRSELRKYSAAIRGLGSDENHLIRELALNGGRLPRRKLQGILAGKIGITAERFDHAWVKLQQDRRIVYVSRNKDSIGFADPLLGPFLRAWILTPEDNRVNRQRLLFDGDVGPDSAKDVD